MRCAEWLGYSQTEPFQSLKHAIPDINFVAKEFKSYFDAACAAKAQIRGSTKSAQFCKA